MPQSFQVILQVQIPAVMHGACCQISWLEELSVLLPGCPVGFYDILQFFFFAFLQCYHLFPQSAPRTQRPAPGLNAASLSYPAATATPSLLLTCSQLFLHFLLSSCFAKITIFWLVTPILLSHQLPL